MSTWAASSVDCGSATRTPARRTSCERAVIAVEERRLAADSAQHAQPGGGVGAERGQLADLLALLELPRLERLDDEAEQEDEHGHADQDDEPEHDGRRQQDERDDEVRRRPRRPAGP